MNWLHRLLDVIPLLHLARSVPECSKLVLIVRYRWLRVRGIANLRRKAADCSGRSKLLFGKRY